MTRSLPFVHFRLRTAHCLCRINFCTVIKYAFVGVAKPDCISNTAVGLDPRIHGNLIQHIYRTVRFVISVGECGAGFMRVNNYSPCGMLRRPKFLFYVIRTATVYSDKHTHDRLRALCPGLPG